MRSEPRGACTAVWPPSLSLAATREIDVSFFSSGYLDVSVRRVPLRTLWIGVRMHAVCACGFPHSDICGSKGMCPSPQLFAACHVFHRLLVPGHPPCALFCLTSFFPSVRSVGLPGHSASRRMPGRFPALFFELSFMNSRSSWFVVFLGCHDTSSSALPPSLCSGVSASDSVSDLCMKFSRYTVRHAAAFRTRLKWDSVFLPCFISHQESRCSGTSDHW